MNQTGPIHKEPFIAAIVVATAIFLGGWLSLLQVKSEAEDAQKQSIGQDLGKLAEIIAQRIDPELHRKAKNAKTKDDENYKAAIKPLIEAHKILQNVEFIYTIQSIDGIKMKILLDTANFPKEIPKQVKPNTSFMEEYSSENLEEDKKIAEAIYNGQRFISTDLVKDKYGILFTAIVPLKFGDKTALGIEVSRKILKERIQTMQGTAASSLRLILIIALICGTITGLIVSRLVKSNKERNQERKKRLAIEEDKAILAEITAHTPSGILLTCVDGNTEWVNNAFTKTTGYTLEEMRGKKPGHVLQGIKTNPETKKRIRKHLQEGTLFQEEILNYKKCGEPFWIKLEIQPLFDKDKKVKKYIGVQTDVTDLHAAKAQSEIANQAKTEFLAVMSHEIRTPLNGVIGFCRLLQNTVTNPEQKEYLKAIQISGNNLLSIVNEILDFSKIEAGETKADTKPEQIVKFLEEVFSHYELLPKKNVKIIHTIQNENGEEWWELDKPKVQQILNNLISNAIKFTPTGTVTLTAKITKLEDEGGNLEVTIQDTGIGIPGKKQKRMFEAFVQADPSTARKFGGTGLGLYISYKIAQILKGKLILKESTEIGTTFLLEIPLKVAKKPLEEVEPYAIPLPYIPILIVEDNAINAKLLSIILKKKGQTADIAIGGREALHACEIKDYTLIFMDVEMPGLDGIQTTKILKAQGNKSYICAVTAHATSKEKDRCKEIGMDDFITKPVHPDKIQLVIQKATRDLR